MTVWLPEDCIGPPSAGECREEFHRLLATGRGRFSLFPYDGPLAPAPAVLLGVPAVVRRLPSHPARNVLLRRLGLALEGR